VSRVLAAMSGGVDSSVAAALLVEAGHEVVGVTMKTFCYSDVPSHGKTCCGLDGITDAKRVADALGIPHYVFDVEEDFTRDVIDDFVAEYARGRTPNPCVRCNSNTKFRDLLERGRALGCDRIATGHYVCIEHDPEGSRLRLGELTKEEVREQARALELVTADKPESQEICFVPTGDYRDLLKKRLEGVHPALEPGKLVRSDGRVVGEHGGYAGFTVGQRKGLGGGFPEPMFVLEIRAETREVVIGPREELFRDVVEIGQVSWLSPPPGPGTPVHVQLRYGAPAVRAVVVAGDGDPRVGDSIGAEGGADDAGHLTLALDEPRPAITPGQSAVLFDGDRVLGGGRIAGAARGSTV